MIYWEFFSVGQTFDLGRHTFTEEEIVAFGRQFDPQPFHIDPAAARSTAFGGLVASGWHTCSVGMRLMCERYLNESASLGSPGLDSVRWLSPVRPGDTVRYRHTVIATRASSTRPGVGLVKNRWEAENQNAQLVLTMEGWSMFGRRPASPA
jgi:acyl dehydratase